MTIRVLLADDQPLLRHGFALILRAQPDIEVIGEAADGAEAVRLTGLLRPDVVLMDVRMPGTDGIEATRQLAGPDGPGLAASPRPRVLILTTFDLDEYVYDALRAGASGFLLKDAPTEEVVGAVRAVAAGNAVLSPAVTRRLLDQVGRRLPAAVSRGPGLEQLTEREHEVLRMLAAGLSNAEIAQALVVSDATVKSHVSSLLGKLGLRDRVQAVIFAYETGLVRASQR